MTAEIAVMNTQSVALAADSAVTLSGGTGEKIYASANKIFMLSKYQPVGVMIYGNASLLQLPWETIIKSYRRHLRTTNFRTLREYAHHFVSFLGSSHAFFPSDVQREYVEANCHGYYELILNEVRAAVDHEIAASGSISASETEAVVSRIVGDHHADWASAPLLPFAPDNHADQVAALYEATIQRTLRYRFEKLPLADNTKAQLVELAVFLLSREPPIAPVALTGVVIAGFGNDDLFPSMTEVIVDGVANDQLICWQGRDYGVDREGNTAYVGAFAQSEMVSRFMAGVDPAYQELIEQSLSDIMVGYTDEIFRALGGRAPAAAVRRQIAEARDAMLADYVERLSNHRNATYVASVLSVVNSLPPNELADMAESLVNLTSFKRRVSMESESVGGPIDVAVITAGDGFVWIRRKHYFEADRNPQFFANYYREE
jgi:hypothetical protein